MIYSLPYLLFLAILMVCAFLAWNYKDNIKVQHSTIIVSIVLVLLFFGLRGFCFYDWNSYYPLFINKTWSKFFHPQLGSQSTEPGFTILLLTCKSIWNNYHFFVFVCTIINTALLYRFLSKRTNNIPMGLVVCISMGGLYLYTDLMRNAISILIFINSIEYIEKKKPIPYFSLCLLACTFHSTAVLYIPLYFILNRKINKWLFISIFAVGNIILLLKIPVLMSIISLVASFINPELEAHINAYTKLMHEEGFQISIGYLERLFTGIMVIIYINKLRKVRANNDIFINSLLLYFIMFFFFSEFKTLSLRLSLLFSFAYWTLWTDLLKCITIRSNKYLFAAFISIYCLFKMYGSTNNPIAKYDAIYWNDEPYHLRKIYHYQHFNDK